jgi:hypothetical protein
MIGERLATYFHDNVQQRAYILIILGMHKQLQTQNIYKTLRNYFQIYITNKILFQLKKYPLKKIVSKKPIVIISI